MKTVSLTEALEENKSPRESIADLQSTVEWYSKQYMEAYEQSGNAYFIKDYPAKAREAIARLKARGHWVEEV